MLSRLIIIATPFVGLFWGLLLLFNKEIGMGFLLVFLGTVSLSLFEICDEIISRLDIIVKNTAKSSPTAEKENKERSPV